MEATPELIDSLLDRVEQLELLSLSWGYVDGSLSQEEVDSLAGEVVSSAGATISPGDLVDAMVSGCLLFEFSNSDGFRYRSRFAEGARLLTRLKQLMPNRHWLASPELVSDYRVDARPRVLPKRDIPLGQVLESLDDLPAFDDLRRRLISAFIGNRQLSGFQVRAARAVMRPAQRDNGTVLTSGTGSGKTLAFYLPLAAEMAPLNRPGTYWTKAVAVFPRVELLKDQFSQAYSLLSPLASTLTDLGCRPFRLGTFFGGTPYDATQESVRRVNWVPSKLIPGYKCPFLTCPNCSEDMVWLNSDIDAKHEALTCEGNCGVVIDESHVVLTRRKAQNQPPDILFTTAESLNRQLSDTFNRKLFGIRPERALRARYLLLDEIHTYGGTSGAQTAMVFRRWRHARGDGEPVRYVGLSATLEEAPRFFATLTGLNAASVTEVAPQEDELEFMSKEYQLVLRGDLSSRTQLLSTTIQVCFLMSRLLDPPGSQPMQSEGRFGSRVFAFTDDLDATNRLFDFLRDAEAMDIFGNPKLSKAPLAVLRAASQPDRRLRAELGQDWEALERLGRPLGRRLTIGRTSSQDQGVSAEADVIVATASLEVGFNDPEVGAVIQHKAPHHLANFMQRKGRAGRSPEMRPWTVTILSDFGRDRQMYQAYDQLFDPVLRPFSLPVRNRYVLRMQATFALLDWLANTNDTSQLRGSWWEALSRPHPGNEWHARRQTKTKEVISGILESPGPSRDGLADYVHRALKLESVDEANEILWGAPRSLLLEVLPTLERRLQTDWQLHPESPMPGPRDIISSHPLPEFLPDNLFSDLNLPEVQVVLPPATTQHEIRTDSMGISDAIRRLVPGRVTRRFAYERGKLNHWIFAPFLNGERNLEIDSYAEENERVASIPVRLNGEVTEVACYRPWKVRLDIVKDSDVRSTSNGFQEWRNHFLAEGEPIPLSTANDPQWGQAVDSLNFYLHAANSHLVVRRFALEANATVKRADADSTEFRVRTLYVDSEGNRAALGFEQNVDAVRVVANLPTPEFLAELADASENLPAWRTAYFRDLVMEDPELSSITNWFQRDRLHRTMLLVLTRAAVDAGTTISSVLDEIEGSDFSDQLFDASSLTLTPDPSNVDPEVDGIPEEIEEEARIISADMRWKGLLSENVTQQRLISLAREMCNPERDAWGIWLRERIHETLGQAILAAAYDAVPGHVAEDSLLLDLDRGDPHFDPGDSVEVWLTESAIGGSGAVEALAHAASEDPRLLVQSLDAAVLPRDEEMTSAALDELIESFVAVPEVADLVGRVRTKTGHTDRVDALADLNNAIGRQGIYSEIGLTIAMNHRILRAGTGPDTDELIRDLVREWHSWEQELGVGIDLQTFCALVSGHPTFSGKARQLLSADAQAGNDFQSVAGVLYGLLWPRQWEVRARVLQSYQAYWNCGYTDPALIRDLLLDPGPEPIEFGAENWEGQFADNLSTKGVVRVRVSSKRREEFRDVLFRLLGTPVEVDYLQFYPIVSQYQHQDGMILTFVLKEMF